MRSSWMKVNPKSNGKSVKEKEKQTCRERGLVKTEAENRVMKPQTEKRQDESAAIRSEEKGMEQNVPQILRENQSL